ncbi:hypothetical protein ACP4OV_023437 [Aristida adscensionis]
MHRRSPRPVIRRLSSALQRSLPHPHSLAFAVFPVLSSVCRLPCALAVVASPTPPSLPPPRSPAVAASAAFASHRRAPPRFAAVNHRRAPSCSAAVSRRRGSLDPCSPIRIRPWRGLAVSTDDVLMVALTKGLLFGNLIYDVKGHQIEVHKLVHIVYDLADISRGVWALIWEGSGSWRGCRRTVCSKVKEGIEETSIDSDSSTSFKTETNGKEEVND